MPRTNLLENGDWGGSDYEDSSNIRMELERPDNGVLLGQTDATSKAPAQLNELGKRVLALVPMRDGDLG